MASLSDALVTQLLHQRRIASLATHNPNGTLHVVAVWYWFDGHHIFVATSSKSRKAKNLLSNPTVSLMIDAREPTASCGATVVGSGSLVSGKLSEQWNAEIHKKYLSQAALSDSRVGPVFKAWDDVTIQIAPASVVAWDMREADRQVFGGAMAENPTYLLPLER